MPLKPLWQDDFAPRSALSVRPPVDVGRDGQMLELREELARRMKTYPGMVDRGTMKAADADRHMATWHAIVADYEREAGRTAPPDDVAWDTKVRELRRELALRRQFYPTRISSPTNPLTHADAVKQLERIDAVHHRYWAELFAFTPAGQDWRDDAHLALWIIDAHIRRHAPAWDAATADADLLLPSEATAAAQRTANRWRRIRDTAATATGERTTSAWPTREIFTAMIQEVFVAMDATPSYADPIGNQLGMLIRWLELRMYDQQQPERIAA